MQFAGTVVNDLQYSFGEPPEQLDHQIPHVVAPIFPTFDKVIVSGPGEVPPALGTPFPEDPDYRKLRMKFKLTSDANVDLNSTYSFSVNTANLDLVRWTLVNIPLCRPLNLGTFFGNAAIQLVGYEIPAAIVSACPGAHPHRHLNYMFNLRLSQVDEHSVQDLPNAGCSDDEVEEEPGPPAVSGPGEAVGEAEGFSDGQDEDEDLPQSAASHKAPGQSVRKKLFSRQVFGLGDQKKGVSGWLRRHIGGAGEARGRDSKDKDPEGAELFAGEVTESSEYSLTDYDMEAFGDLRYCPASIEMNDFRRDNKRRVFYVLPVGELCMAFHNQAEMHCEPGPPSQSPPASPPLQLRLRTYAEIERVLHLLPVPRMHKNRRLSDPEIRRRQVVESFRQLLRTNQAAAVSRVWQLLEPASELDLAFFGRGRALRTLSAGCEGVVAAASSRRHWAEHLLVLSRTELTLLKGPESRRVVTRVPMGSVLSVKPIPHQETPIPEVSFFQVETFPRIYYFMVASDELRDDWLDCFGRLLGRGTLNSPFDKQFDLSAAAAQVTEVEELYLAKSGCWRLDRKRIFNYRRIVFNPAFLPAANPAELVEGILTKAAFLTSTQAMDKSSIHTWVSFLDDISLLQTLNLSPLSERERAALLLNLYHAMVLHGCLVLGPPPAWTNWNNFFNNISYLFAYEVVTIAELEHNILRAQMSRPSSFSMIAVPQNQFPGLALSHRDFRLNFCINSGSRSLPSKVPVYRAHSLDAQLDEMTALMLREAVELDSVRKAATVPRVSLQDFNSSAGNATNMDLLRTLSYYLRREDRLLLARMLSEQTHISVRHKAPSFRCCLFAVTPPPGPGDGGPEKS